MTSSRALGLGEPAAGQLGEAAQPVPDGLLVDVQPLRRDHRVVAAPQVGQQRLGERQPARGGQLQQRPEDGARGGADQLLRGERGQRGDVVDAPDRAVVRQQAPLDQREGVPGPPQRDGALTDRDGRPDRRRAEPAQRRPQPVLPGALGVGHDEEGDRRLPVGQHGGRQDARAGGRPGRQRHQGDAPRQVPAGRDRQLGDRLVRGGGLGDQQVPEPFAAALPLGRQLPLLAGVPLRGGVGDPGQQHEQRVGQPGRASPATSRAGRRP
ncbi:hypothetical protein [Actinomadura madurae]|uniref:hypothetical protein n=1 Tax=Actinomadura madurae TaxID=1993 RepID=UPI0020D26027|nr:hypothetical protein [Actinomadura madurae]MCP9963890.1 hypothetical protein [Actinomadura madurae]MCP9976368.1 hypothetical protein [Actinomadura madurae]